MPSFYTAGKIWHAPKFQNLRDNLGYDVQARWIDLDSESDIVKNRKDKLWQLCLEDVQNSDFLLLYCEDMAEEHRGALVEVGMAFGMGKRVYAVGKSKTIAPCEISDVAFTHHELWNWVNTDDLLRGVSAAVTSEIMLSAATHRSLKMVS